MSTVAKKNEQESMFLNEAEAVAFFDQQARALLNMSGDEFLKRLDAGEYKNTCDNSRVLKLKMLAPKRSVKHGAQ
jgi:hypothetical protein